MVAFFLLFVVAAPTGFGESFSKRTWTWFARDSTSSGSSYSDLYIDSKSVTRNGDGELVFWTKSKFSKPGKTGVFGAYSKYKVVGERTFRLVRTIDFGAQGQALDSNQLDRAEIQVMHTCQDGETGSLASLLNWLQAAGFYKEIPK